MKRRTIETRFDFQQFENRICLAASAILTDGGSLLVTGDADGPVEIVSTGEQTFQVSDDGTVIGEFDEVNRNIVLRLDDRSADIPIDDVVSIQLGDSQIDNVMASLGNGDNTLVIQGAQPIERAIFLGGEGDDTVSFDIDTEFITVALTGAGDDTVNTNGESNRVRIRTGDGNDTVTLGDGVVANRIGVRLGNGDNSIQSNADTSQVMYIRGGDGVDEVAIGEQSNVGRAIVRLGQGDNNLGLAGTVEGSLFVRAGAGNDTFTMAESATIGRHAGIILGSGDNQFDVSGDFGGSFFIRGGLGDDAVRIRSTADVEGSVGVVLGDGDNSILHNGAIEGDLFATSKNANDQFVVSGTVEGRIRLAPGDQGSHGDDGDE